MVIVDPGSHDWDTSKKDCLTASTGELANQLLFWVTGTDKEAGESGQGFPEENQKHVSPI